MSGDRMAHPLLISLANIMADFRIKSSHNAFVLLALLPVPKFLDKNKKARGILGDRLVHACLDFVLRPLKIGASIGIMMTDPLGYRRFCFTPCAAYMVDTQEAVMLAGVAGKTSHLTLASYKQFGDPIRHQPRTASTTLSQRHAIRSKADPSGDISAYAREAMKYRLNGVDELFWRDWPGAEPSNFLTPEPLHHWHKAFWDHDAKWCIRAVGSEEIDFRFSIVPYRIGFRQFKEGISKLKQVTGREHRDAERYMVAVISGAVPKDFLIAIRAMMDFRYLAQAPVIDDEDCNNIEKALREFHEHKDAILEAKARVGAHNKPIDNWWIPKLEMLQSVVANIRANGAAFQWSADITEHAHITEIKKPARAGNGLDYDSQICRALDRKDKIRRFDLATSIRAAGIQFGQDSKPEIDDDWYSDDDGDGDGDDGMPHRIDQTSDLLARISPLSSSGGPRRQTVNYFQRADDLQQGKHPTAPRPFRTFKMGSTAFQLPRDPQLKKLSIDIASQQFDLPDLRPALAEYLRRISSNGIDLASVPIGGRRSASSGCNLPIDYIQVWTTMRIQLKQYHRPSDTAQPHTLLASPPSKEWPVGRYDTVVVNTDPSKKWPYSGLEGKQKVSIQAMFFY